MCCLEHLKEKWDINLMNEKEIKKWVLGSELCLMKIPLLGDDEEEEGGMLPI